MASMKLIVLLILGDEWLRGTRDRRRSRYLFESGPHGCERLQGPENCQSYHRAGAEAGAAGGLGETALGLRLTH